jgi:hypothetical protein
MKWGLCALAGLLGCATAGSDNGGDGGGPDAARKDSTLPPDSSLVDMLMVQTLAQTSDNTVAAAKSLACGNATSGWTSENSWYRVFPLASFGITGPFHVNEVSFGVQESGTAVQQVQVKLGTYAGTPGATIDTALISNLGATTVNVPVTTTGQTVIAPITATVPANGQLVVEVFTADHTSTTTHFYMGASAGTEMAPGYLRAPACAFPQPQSMKAINASAGALIITVTGTH